MKKMKIFALMLLAGATLLSSCGKDDTTFADPTVSFQGGTTSMVFSGTNSIDINVTFAAEGKIESVSLQGPSLTGAGSTTTTITSKMGTTGTDNAKGQTSAVYLFKVTAADLALAFANHTSLTYTFTVADQEGSSTTGTFTVTMTASGNPIDTYSAILMGAQSNATEGSFLDANTGQVYLSSAAASNQALIDVVYYYGSTNLATLCAPDDATVGGGSGNLTLCQSWSTKNATRFSTTTITEAQFDAMTDDSGISSLTSSNSKSTSLATGNVLSFVTAGGKKGLIKIGTISTGATGSITINVKIQQ